MKGQAGHSSKGRLKEVALLFLKLGFIGFGGPAAHIAMMEEEVVSKRKWMTRQHFLDLMGATNLIPGPNSTEMTMHCGKERAGWAGLFVAGSAFIFPAALTTLILAIFYVEYGEAPGIAPFFIGIKPAVIAIILGALWKLGKKAIKDIRLGVMAFAVLFAAALGLSEVWAILLAGLLCMLFGTLRSNRAQGLAPLGLIFTQLSEQASLSGIFLTFLKVGAILFGSGYVLVAFLQGELVEKLGWLSESELLDAIAMGQVTPGPVLSTATFVGYQLHGFSGALLATLGIFLPSFLFVMLLSPLIPKLSQSKTARLFLDGVNAGAVAIMAWVTWNLGLEVLIDYKSCLISAIALFLTFGPYKVSSMLIVLVGMLLGYGLHWIP